MTIPVPTYLWNLNEVSGDALESISGAYMDVVGPTQNVAGHIPGMTCYSFDGSNDYCVLPLVRDVGALMHKQADFTISFWLNAAAGNAYDAPLAHSGSGGTGNRWMIRLNNQQLSNALNGDGGESETETINGMSLGVWHLCIIDYKQSTLEANMYVDGVAASQSGNLTTSLRQRLTSPFGVGAKRFETTPESFFEGLIQQVAFWDGTILDSGQRAELYNGGVGVDITPPTSYDITSSSGQNGSVSPDGVTAVDSGTNQTYTMIPDNDYAVSDVLVDDVSVGAVTSYEFTNVQTAHTISVTFSKLPGSNLSMEAETETYNLGVE
ncbi:LamG domain-containing protein [bacterium]|nr:LamG domain-containing protein [bacterium]